MHLESGLPSNCFAYSNPDLAVIDSVSFPDCLLAGCWPLLSLCFMFSVCEFMQPPHTHTQPHTYNVSLMKLRWSWLLWLLRNRKGPGARRSLLDTFALIAARVAMFAPRLSPQWWPPLCYSIALCDVVPRNR